MNNNKKKNILLTPIIDVSQNDSLDEEEEQDIQLQSLLATDSNETANINPENILSIETSGNGDTSDSDEHRTNRLHLMNIFNPFQNNTIGANRNFSSNMIQDFSSESLLMYVKESNFQKVNEILDYTVTSQLTNKGGSVYNTITSINDTSFKKSRIDLEITDEAKQTPLIIACRQDAADIAHMLIAHGANVNASDADSWTPLLNVAKNGNLHLAEVLLNHKAFYEDRDMGGFTPLMWACYKNKVDVVKLLLKNGSNPNAQCKNLVCCLSWAAGRGFTEVVAELIKCYNIRINLQDQVFILFKF